MAYKTLATRYYVKKEEAFNQGASFTDADIVEVTQDSSLKPEIDVIERKVVNCTYINKPGLPGKETGSGTLAFELIPLVITDNTLSSKTSSSQYLPSKDLLGSAVLEVMVGEREEAGTGTGAIIRADAAPQMEVTITANSNNKGDGTLDDFGYNDDTAKTETWTIKCTDASTAGSEVWSVSGSVSGDQVDATTGEDYDNGIIKFKITAGTAAFAVGDEFTIDMVSHIAYKIYEVKDGEEGDAVLYKLGRPCGDEKSLTAMVLYGCDETDSRALILTGIVPNSVEFDFPVADVSTIKFDVGAAGFKTEEGLYVPNCNVMDVAIPYVGKNAKFIIDGVEKEAKDVKVTIENTISDREAITSTGITNKVVTKKTVKGSFTITFENWDELNKFKNNGYGELYIELKTEDVSGGEHRFAIYQPYIKYTAVSVEDDDGVLANKIEYEGYIHPVLGEAIYIAHK